MARFGLRPEDFPEERFGIWPENWQVFDIFLSMQTQWRTGMNGPTGLDYSALESLFRMNRVKRKQQRDHLEAIQIMERAALKAMAENR
ncbi:MAG: hypothetical protein FH750_12365 [Pseudomonas stutzeri]|nr:hypothetical protein [Stutzerimonas stutzeri]